MSKTDSKADGMIRGLVGVGVIACVIGLPGPLGWLLVMPVLVMLLPNTRLLTRVLTAALFLFAGVMVLPMVHHTHRPAYRSLCKSNLKQLGLALILYRDNQGKASNYPPYDGARFLVHLYRTGVTTEPELFLCPKSEDENREGAQLARGPIPPEACSYAGRRNRDQTTYPGIFTRRGASETAIASDDDEGAGKRFNHGDALIVLFLDGHVEEIPLDEPQVAGGLGGGRLLDPLAN